MPPALNKKAISIKMADPLIFEGEVLQHPTTPVINETNMKKKAVMKSAIIARPICILAICSMDKFLVSLPSSGI
jgi:hypothetical protein